MKRLGMFLTGAAVLIGMVIHSVGQTPAPKGAPWLVPYTPTRLEWLALETQANEGVTQFGDNGVTVNFYMGRNSVRTGEIYCDLVYLPKTEARIVQAIEEGIVARFDLNRRLYPWARLTIIKKALASK